MGVKERTVYASTNVPITPQVFPVLDLLIENISSCYCDLIDLDLYSRNTAYCRETEP